MAVLLAVPNLSEGRELETVHRLVDTLLDPAALLDFHFDEVHNRAAVTIAGTPEALRTSLEAGARAAVAEIDMTTHEGAHPCIGALDVCPIVFLLDENRVTARHEAAEVGRWIGDELDVPVFLYGDLAATEERRERAHFREGGLERLGDRMESGELVPDFGPTRPHPTAGATLVTARPPLAAFNIELDRADAAVAQRVAAALRESGGGPAGVRAIGRPLEGGRSQVSTNVHDPIAVPLRIVVERVAELAAEQGARPVESELVGLVPAAAMQGFPSGLPIRGFDPERHVIERAISR
ncbi:MAG: glutamate formimidoyltransferase [Solirubrobacterales bacterium]